MDFGFLFYMGFITVWAICLPPLLTALATGMLFALGNMKVITISKKQMLTFGGGFLILAFIANCLIIWILSKDVYAM
jgi:hypothetical protein